MNVADVFNRRIRRFSPWMGRFLPPAQGDRAMPPERSKELIQTIKKIPIFQGLSLSQVQAVLKVCVSQTYQAEEAVCASGASSEEMYILLSGELGVVTADGVQVATLHPVTTVGEMGLITKKARVASVKATKPSHVLVLPKSAFDYLLNHDSAVQARIYRNVIEALADKIVNDNLRLRDHLQDMVQEEKRIREYRCRAEAAVRLLVQDTGMDPEKATARVDEEMIDETMRVLIVDEEPEIRRLVANALEGYEVVEAANGHEALGSVRERHPDLLITDIKTSEIDGHALLIALREEAPDLPVLAISGFYDDESIGEYDLDGFMCQPFAVERFRATVEDALTQGDG